MRKHLILTLIASLFVSACATVDESDTRAIDTPATKRTGPVSPPARAPVKARKTTPVLVIPGAPIDGIVIQHKNRTLAALFAAVGGGLERSSADEYMDKQLEDLQRALQSEIEQGEIRVERRVSDHAIRVSMTPGAGFDNLSSVVKPGFLATLSRIAPVLTQYNKTLLTVIGYIENVGPDARNQMLAERRAKSVADYFVNRSVEPLRLQSNARSYETRAQPGKAGKQPVRRVELWIQPIVAQ